MAAALIRDPNATGATFGIPYLGISLAFFIAVVDIASFCVAALVGTPSAKAGPSGPVSPGQGPGDIERVEG
jgi:hypothetical protein